jgi:hypothetical protein
VCDRLLRAERVATVPAGSLDCGAELEFADEGGRERVGLADWGEAAVDVRADDRIGPRDAEAFGVTARACEAAGWEFRRLGNG